VKKISAIQYQTKDGRPITFKEIPFKEDTDQRGWVVHDIEAFINGELAGYIKCSYIPKEKWDNIYKNNIWKFRRVALGNYDIPDELIEKNNDEEIAKDHAKRYEYGNAEYFVQKEKEKAKKEYQMYYLYFVDKPIVDFIRTYEKFQRQHVALALHNYMNQWLQDNFGLHLWLSYCRTDKGKCFYDSNMIKVKQYKYRQKMIGGYRKTREYISKNKNWYKKAQSSGCFVI